MSEDPPAISYTDSAQEECREDRKSLCAPVTVTISKDSDIGSAIYDNQENDSAYEVETLYADTPKEVGTRGSQLLRYDSASLFDSGRESFLSSRIVCQSNNWYQWKKEKVDILSSIIQEAKSLGNEDDVPGIVEGYLDKRENGEDIEISNRMEKCIIKGLKHAKDVDRDILILFLRALVSIRKDCRDYKLLRDKLLSLSEKLVDNSLLKEEVIKSANVIESDNDLFQRIGCIVNIIGLYNGSKRENLFPIIEKIRGSIRRLGEKLALISDRDITSRCISVAEDARKFVLILDKVLSQYQELNVTETTKLKILIIERSVILDGINKILAGKCSENVIKQYCLSILSAVDRSCISAQRIISARDPLLHQAGQRTRSTKNTMSLSCITPRPSNAPDNKDPAVVPAVPGIRSASIITDVSRILNETSDVATVKNDHAQHYHKTKDTDGSRKFSELRCQIQSKIKVATIDQSPPSSCSLEHTRLKHSSGHCDTSDTLKGRKSPILRRLRGYNSLEPKNINTPRKQSVEKPSWIDELVRVQSGHQVVDRITPPVDPLIEYTCDRDSIEISPSTSQVVSGTLEGLIECLTFHDQVLDRLFASAFLLLFRQFATSIELFDALVKRFSISPPQNITEDQLTIWKERKQIPIKLRTYNVLRLWVETFWIPDTDDMCLPEIRKFAVGEISGLCNNLSRRLVELVDKRISGGTPTVITNTNMIPLCETPNPIIPKHKILNLLDLDTIEVARQLTLIVNKLFMLIKPQELVDQAWNKKDEKWKSTSSNVKAVISISNKITFWAVCTILSEKGIVKRASILKFFIKICTKLAIFHNYDTLMAIKSAIDMSCIARLRRTWDTLPNKTKSAYERITSLLDFGRNFYNYRNSIKNAAPPCIPFLGLYLTDLTFIESGVPTYREVRGKKLINFNKFLKMYKIIHGLQLFQMPYPFQEVQQIQDFILNDINNVEVPSQSKLYEISLELEPKEMNSAEAQSSAEAKVKALQKAGLLKL